MAALETPWLSMSAPRTSLLRPDPIDHHGTSRPSSPSFLAAENDGGSPGLDFYGSSKPTYAAFSPVTALSGPTVASAAKRRSTILIHQKSPLLMATPPQITRALAYSHPFLLPLNKLAGLLTWTTGDPWESFILVLVWWGTVLYGDGILRYGGPIVLVLALIAGMYGRRYSPLSTSGWNSEDSHTGNNGGSGALGGVGYFLFGIGAGNGSSNSNNNSTNTTSSAKTAKDGSPSKKTRAKNATGSSENGAAGVANGSGSGGGGGGGGNNGGHTRTVSEAITPARHQKTLDEIVETLKEFTGRCNVLLEPLLEMTDFLSTQSTPTSATTRPALIALFVRILLCTPFWILLTLPPLHIITTRRTVLVFGTLILTWHSRVMRVSRTILWRSATIRRTVALITGLKFEGPMRPSKTPSYVTAGGSISANDTPATAAAALQSKLSGGTKTPRRLSTPRESELTRAIRRARAGHDAGVRFTFILYENQRRWVGLGWTTSLFAYERPAWTDEHNNEVPPKDEFELPEVEDGSRMRWRWVEGSRWQVDGVPDDAVRVEKTGPNGEHKDTWDYDGDGGRMGWVYYDNKWQTGRRGQDGWNRWTRRRKWYRDAELVEVDADDAYSNSDDHANSLTPTSTSQAASSSPPHAGTSHGTDTSEKRGLDGEGDGDAISLMSTSSKSTRGLTAPSLRRRGTDSNGRAGVAPAVTTAATVSVIPINGLGHARRDSVATTEEDEALSSSVGVKIHETRNNSWGLGDEARMGLE